MLQFKHKHNFEHIFVPQVAVLSRGQQADFCHKDKQKIAKTCEFFIQTKV